MVRGILKRAGQLVLIPIAAGLAVMILMAATYLLPAERMKTNARASLDIFAEEGLYHSAMPNVKGTMQDNFVDSLYLNQALVSTRDADLLHCVLSGYDFAGPKKDEPIDNLTAAVTDPESVTLANTEKRFFGGHVAVVKLLLLLTDYSGIRQINLYFCLGLTAWLGWLMYRRGYGRLILPVMLSLLFLRPVPIGLNMSFTSIYGCMLMPCIAMLLMKKETVREKAWLIFGLTGSVTFCFIMNYFQLLCFGMPFLFYGMIAGFPEKPGKVILKIIDLFIAFMIGYAGAMVFKWALYAVLIDGNIFREMMDHVLMRTDVDQGSRAATVWFNTKIAFGSLWWDLAEAAFIAWTVIRWRKDRVKITISGTEILVLAAMLLFPVGRLAILSNHSYMHAWFTYRVLMMPVMALNLLMAGKRKDAGQGGKV